MSQIVFLHPLHGFIALLATAVFACAILFWRNKQDKYIADKFYEAKFVNANLRLLYLIPCLLLTVALASPASKMIYTNDGTCRNTQIILDASLSMHAEDMLNGKSRIASAKLLIFDLLNECSNAKFGFASYSGFNLWRASPTDDLSALLEVMEDWVPSKHHANNGASDVYEALKLTAEKQKELLDEANLSNNKDWLIEAIVLITDGGMSEGSKNNLHTIINEGALLGVSIHLVVLGDDSLVSIPVYEGEGNSKKFIGYFKVNDQAMQTFADASNVRVLADQTGGIVVKTRDERGVGKKIATALRSNRKIAVEQVDYKVKVDYLLIAFTTSLLFVIFLSSSYLGGEKHE